MHDANLARLVMSSGSMALKTFRSGCGVMPFVAVISSIDGIAANLAACCRPTG
jgi:hypothetical protein